MKKFYFLLLACIIMPTMANSTIYYYSANNLIYKCNSSNHTAEVYSVLKGSTATSYTFENIITGKSGGKYTVNSVASNAFTRCGSLGTLATTYNDEGTYDPTGIKTITLNDSLLTISSNAFTGCTGMTSCVTTNAKKLTTIADSAFFQCSALKTFTLPANVTSIGIRSFYRCSVMTTFDTSNNTALKSIGTSAFSTNPKLTSFTAPSTLTTMGGSAFYHDTGLTSVDFSSSKLTKTNKSTFNGCTELASAKFPSSTMTTIGVWTFYNCAKLSSFSMPNSVTSVADSAFWGCSGMTSCTIAAALSNLKTIGVRAFGNCSALTTIVIPSATTSIGNYAFDGCSSLTISYYPTADASTYNSTSNQFKSIKSIKFNSGVTSVPTYICYNNTNLQTVTFNGTTVTSIGIRAFYGCTGLTAITSFPNKLETIGSYAFYNTTGITGTITIPASVTTIGTSAFSGCGMSRLAFTNSTTSPSQLTSVSSSAFYNCANLKYIDCSLSDPSVFNSSAFGSNNTVKTNARFVVPIGLEEAYHNASATSGFTHLVATGTLKKIVENGIVGGDYQYHYRITNSLTNRLVGMLSENGILYAKDFNANAEQSEQGSLTTYPGQSLIQASDYDQSNWVAISGLESPDDFVGKYITANTLTAALTNNTNSALTFESGYDVNTSTYAEITQPSNASMATTSTQQARLTKNTFIPANFVDQNEYFFVKPKANEVAHVMWAVYGGNNNFYIVAKQVNENGEYFNGSDIKGGFTIGTTDYTFTEGTQYEFDAVITKAESSAGDGARRKAIAYDASSLASDYVVYPIVSTIVVNGDNLSTGINDVNAGKTVASRTYYNLTGAQSSEPFSGVNIMVTTYTDGCIETSKMLR